MLRELVEEPRLQSPEIGNALRQALTLTGAGGMPMDMARTVAPVAIVADVRDLLNRNEISAQHYGLVDPAVAAQYPYALLEWQAAAAGREFRDILVDRIVVTSATTTFFYLALGNALLAGASTALPRRTLSSLQSAATVGRVISGTSVNAPGVALPTRALIRRTVAGNECVFDFRHQPLVLDEPTSMCVVMGDVVNTTLYATFEWRERVRG